MKKVFSIFLIGFTLAVVYNLKLYWSPFKRKSYYSNKERVEGYVFDRHKYKVVLVGSSLSGCFEGRDPFSSSYFNLFMPRTGSCTGVEIIRRSNKIPDKLFVEINHIDRGIDSTLLAEVFENELYAYKSKIPILQTKSKLLVNVLDLAKKPTSNVNKVKPPAPLFNKLLDKAQQEWSHNPDKERFEKEYERLAESLDIFASQGCKITFFEAPVDTSISDSRLINYQRSRLMELAKQKGFAFIPVDRSRAYNTGDGIHLLQADRDIFVNYFKREVKKLKL